MASSHSGNSLSRRIRFPWRGGGVKFAKIFNQTTRLGIIAIERSVGMKAVYYEAFGDAGVLKLGSLPTPTPGPGQVLVQIAATSVNPIDRRLRAGELQSFFKTTFPIIPGWDLAGRITALGPEVVGWEVGEAVAGLAFDWTLQHGTYAEFVPVSVNSICRIPNDMTFIQAAALPLVSLTAWQAIVEEAELMRGQSVFIQAGAGGVGSVAISIARQIGAKIYTTTRSRNFEYVRERRRHRYRLLVGRLDGEDPSERSGGDRPSHSGDRRR